jgi:hypothetical protein
MIKRFIKVVRKKDGQCRRFLFCWENFEELEKIVVELFSLGTNNIFRENREIIISHQLESENFQDEEDEEKDQIVISCDQDFLKVCQEVDENYCLVSPNDDVNDDFSKDLETIPVVKLQLGT